MSSEANDKPNIGRPRHLDDAKRREVCALISVGMSMTEAARYVGCAVTTLRREALRNDEFSDALKRAHMGAELSPLHEMRNAARKHWRAAAWLLERTNPDRFSKRPANTLTLEEVGAIMNAIDDIIRHEIPYEHLQHRVVSRLEEFGEFLHREAWLAHRDPCPQHVVLGSSPIHLQNLSPPPDHGWLRLRAMYNNQQNSGPFWPLSDWRIAGFSRPSRHHGRAKQGGFAPVEWYPIVQCKTLNAANRITMLTCEPSFLVDVETFAAKLNKCRAPRTFAPCPTTTRCRVTANLRHEFPAPRIPHSVLP